MSKKTNLSVSLTLDNCITAYLMELICQPMVNSLMLNTAGWFN